MSHEEDSIDFKRWMQGQLETLPRGMTKRETTGIIVESKIPYKRLLEKIDPKDGDLEVLARDFRKVGGTIMEVHGSEITVKVESGSFLISRAYIRRR